MPTPGVLASFWRHLRENFRQAMAVGLVWFGAGTVLLFDYLLLDELPDRLQLPLFVIFSLGAVAFSPHLGLSLPGPGRLPERLEIGDTQLVRRLDQPTPHLARLPARPLRGRVPGGSAAGHPPPHDQHHRLCGARCCAPTDFAGWRECRHPVT